MRFRGLIVCGWCLFACSDAFLAMSQAPSGTVEKVAFDAVSIRQIEAYKRVSAPGSASYLGSPHKRCVYSGDKVVCQQSLGELIQEAYGRKRYEVSGPEWLGEDLFVLQAIYGEGTSRENALAMMRAALEDRFGLRTHLEKKAVTAYVLVAEAGGARLTPADPPDVQKKMVVKNGPVAYVTSSTGKFAAVSMGLDDLGPWIERSAGLDGPVLNKTGLDGLYKIELDWTPSESSGGAEQDMGMVNALKRQAGILLRKERTPIVVLAIDHVERIPYAN